MLDKNFFFSLCLHAADEHDIVEELIAYFCESEEEIKWLKKGMYNRPTECFPFSVCRKCDNLEHAGGGRFFCMTGNPIYRDGICNHYENWDEIKASCKAELEKLVQRMLLTKKTYTEEWYELPEVYREAANWDKSGSLSASIEMLDELDEVEVEKKECLYFIIGNMLGNSKHGYHHEAFQYYLDRIGKEKDEKMILEMLGFVAKFKLAPEVDISVLLTLSEDDRSEIRQSAIKALIAAETIESRYALCNWLKKEDVKAWKTEIVLALEVLNEIGLIEDIQNIKRHTNSKIKKINHAANFAVNAIIRRDNLKKWS